MITINGVGYESFAEAHRHLAPEGLDYTTARARVAALGWTEAEALEVVSRDFVHGSARTRERLALSEKAAGMRTCFDCGESKKLSKYNKDHKGRLGLEHRCRDCARRKKRRKTYRMSREEAERLVAMSGGRCMICGTDVSGDRRNALDHCHATGKARGILCNSCNPMIGRAGDNPEILKRAIAYLAGELTAPPGGDLRVAEPVETC